MPVRKLAAPDGVARLHHVRNDARLVMRPAHLDRRRYVLRPRRGAGHDADALHQAGLHKDIRPHLPAAHEADAHGTALALAQEQRFLKSGAENGFGHGRFQRR
jgi:hypothetical protein